MKKRILSVAVLLVLTVSLVFAAGMGETAQKDYKKDGIVVANVRWDMGDIAFNGDQFGSEQEMKAFTERTGIEVKMLTFGSNDPTEQIKAAETFMGRGIDGMLLSSFQSMAVRPIIEECNRRDIPVVTHDSQVPGGKQVCIVPDAVEAGAIVGQALLDELVKIRGEEFLKNQGGHIIEIRCIVTLGVDIARYTGWRSVVEPFLEKYPKVTTSVHVAECNATKARRVADAAIARYGDNLLAFWCLEGTTAVGGVVPALKEAGRFFPKDDSRHIVVTTIDGTEEEAAAHRHGDLDFTIDNGKLTQGRMAMRALLQWITEGWDSLPGPGEPLWPEEKSVRQPYQVFDGATKDPAFEGHLYSFRNLLIPTDADGYSEDVWGNAYYHAVNGKWPWE
jgi:ABC-type sugar transport system substrate-binding protein